MSEPLDLSFNFYVDNNLSALALDVEALFPESPDPAETRAIRQVWLGSRLPDRRLVSPDGGRSVTARIIGDAADHIRLATTRQGLANAAAGAPLVLPAPVTRATSIWLQLDAALLPAGRVTGVLRLIDDDWRTPVEEVLQ